MDIKVIQANYQSDDHEHDIQFLLDAYASDPMGGGKPLEKSVKQNIVKELAERSFAFTLLAYVDKQPAGLANCFEGFSTFSCKPLINIHDFAVVKEYRGRGISQMLLTKIEQIAKETGCCKITLEVLSNNQAAKAAYKKFGFTSYELDPAAGTALFWQKPIS